MNVREVFGLHLVEDSTREENRRKEFVLLASITFTKESCAGITWYVNHFLQFGIKDIFVTSSLDKSYITSFYSQISTSNYFLLWISLILHRLKARFSKFCNCKCHFRPYLLFRITLHLQSDVQNQT